MRHSPTSNGRMGSSKARIRGVVPVLAWILAVSPASSRGQEARPASATPADPKVEPLARYVPRRDLFSYIEFQGLDAHADPWKRSAAFKVLNETRLGTLWEDLVGQIAEVVQQSVPPDRRIRSAEVVDLIKLAARQGFALGTWGKDPDRRGVVAVLRRGDQPAIRRWLEASLPPGPRPEGANPMPRAGRTLHPLDRETAWWVEKGDLVLSNRPDEVLSLLDGKASSAVDHPLRAALLKPEHGFQPAAVGFLDLDVLPTMSADLGELGLDGLRRVELAWGFQDDALRTVLRAVAPAPRRGLLALLDQPTFDAGSLPRLPADLQGFTVLSTDLDRTYDRILAWLKAVNPQRPDRSAEFEEAIRQQFGLDVRKDLLAGLGPKLAVYVQPAGGDAPANRAATLITQFSGLTISAQVRDEAALARSIDPLMKMVNVILESVARPNPAGAAALTFRTQDGPRPTYVMDLPPDLIPPPFATIFRPTVKLGKDELIVAASPAAAEKAANVDGRPPAGRWQPSGAFLPVFRRLPGGLVYLNISDPRDTMPAMIEALPILAQQINAQAAQAQRMRDARGIRPPVLSLRIDPDHLPRADELSPRLFPASTALVVDAQGATLVAREPIPGLASPATSGILVALLLPAVQSAREAARRAQCTNNLKQIALALHNYHDANGRFPGPAITDKDGKPLLSWRVAILPYVEQQELYNKFKLDEPWDSPHNQALLAEMPPTYLCPSRRNVAPSTTTYRVFQGPSAIFEKGEGIGIADITDGTSNTVLVVEAKEAVPWTRPDGELPFDRAAAPSLFGAGSPHPGGFNTAFGDGAVRFLRSSISLEVFKALITRNGGEVIAPDRF